MLGGTEVETESDAAAFTNALRKHPGAWVPRDLEPEPIQLGEELELEPCVRPDWPFRTPDHPCPREELWPENALGARLVFAALPEHTRPLMPAFARALLSDLPQWEADQVLVRVMRTLQSEQVTGWLRQAIEGELE